jgi:hypothetical protein
LWLPTIPPLIDDDLVDWCAGHAYWTRLDQLHDEEHGGYWRRFLSLGVPLAVTEFSEKNPFTPRAEKGRQYRMFYADLPGDKVFAAFAFVSSASNPAFNDAGETWVFWNGGVSEIPSIVGAR